MYKRQPLGYKKSFFSSTHFFYDCLVHLRKHTYINRMELSLHPFTLNLHEQNGDERERKGKGKSFAKDYLLEKSISSQKKEARVNEKGKKSLKNRKHFPHRRKKERKKTRIEKIS